MRTRKISIIALFVAMVAAFTMAFLTGTNIAKADTEVFEFENGAYVKLADNGGLRFRLKMDAETATEIKGNANETLYFYVASSNNMASVTTAAQAEALYKVTPTPKAWRVTVAKNKIYAGTKNGELDGYYYANVLVDVNNLTGADAATLLAYRTTDFVAVAALWDSSSSSYTKFAKSVNRNMRDTASATAFRTDSTADVKTVYSWIGSSADYAYSIANAADLKAFAVGTITTYKTGNYKLANDIDLGSDTVTSPEIQSGSYRGQANCFEGTFDGKDHTIDGGRYSKAGLFGNMFVNAVVKNVSFTNAHWANSGSNAALIAWCVRGKILNVNIDAVRESTNGAAKTYVIYELFPNAQATNATELTNVKISVCNEKNAASSISPAIQWYNWSASSGTPYDGVLNNVQATMYTQYAGTSTTLDGTMPTTGITVTYVYTYDATKTGVMTRVTKDGRTAYEMKRTSTANVWESRFNLLDNNSSGGDQTTKDFLKDKVFAFDFYYTGDVGATFRTYTTMFDLTRVNSATVGYVNIYDASGNRVSRIVKNNWYTIKVNGSALYALDSDNKPFYFILGCDGSQIANAAGYNYSTDKAYISDVRLLDEEFDDSELPAILISTAEEFLAFAAGTNSTHKYDYYKLANNIDLGDNVISAPYINGNYTAGFAGIFDGDGYVIYNGVVGNGNYGGVFGMIAPRGIIRNVGIANLHLEYSASNAGLPNTVLCFTNNGTLSNVSVSFTYDDSTHATGAYPAFIYCSNAATYNNVVVESYNYSTQSAMITNFKPFISWNRTSAGASTFTNVYVITNSANRTALTGVTYYDIHDSKTFTGITGDIWSDSGDVKVMAREKTVLARYAEKHFIDLADLTYARDMWIKRAAVGDTVSMTRIEYPTTRNADSTKLVLSNVSGYESYADVLSGTATGDGNFELKAYYYAVYEPLFVDGNSNFKFFPVYNSASDGSWKVSSIKDYTFAPDKENVYKFVTASDFASWNGRISTNNFNYASVTGKKLVFEIYTNKVEWDLHIIVNNAADANRHKLNGSGAALNNPDSVLCVYDANGNPVSSVTANAWYKVVIDGDKLTSTQPVMMLRISPSSVFYISNMHFESK